MKPREDLKKSIPQLRRYARALTSHFPYPETTADQLVQTVLLKTIEPETAVRGDLNIHLYKLLSQLHRERQRQGENRVAAAQEKNRSLPCVPQHNPLVPNYFKQSRTLPPALPPSLKFPREIESPEQTQPQSLRTSLRGQGMRAGPAGGRDMAHHANQSCGDAGKPGHFESQRERASAALQSLSLDEKEAYLLVVLEGFKYAHAAQILCISKTALAVRLMRARASLSAANLLTEKSKSHYGSHLVLVK